MSSAMLGRLKSACEENLVPYPCICPCILNPFICIRVVLGWKSQSAVDYKPVGSDLKFCLSSRVFLLKFGLADRRPVIRWPRPIHHITNGQVWSLCNFHFVWCYQADCLRIPLSSSSSSSWCSWRVRHVSCSLTLKMREQETCLKANMVSGVIQMLICKTHKSWENQPQQQRRLCRQILLPRPRWLRLHDPWAMQLKLQQTGEGAGESPVP